MQQKNNYGVARIQSLDSIARDTNVVVDSIDRLHHCLCCSVHLTFTSVKIGDQICCVAESQLSKINKRCPSGFSTLILLPGAKTERVIKHGPCRPGN